MNSITLIEGKPWKSIVIFALPIFLGSLLQQFYNTVDTMMVGIFVDQSSLSAVGTCAVLTNLCIAFSVGFSSGASIVSARFFGGKKYKEITKNAYASFVIFIGLGVLISLLSFVFADVLLKKFILVPNSIIDLSRQYFQICAAGFLFQFIYNGVAALLRSIGDSKASLYFLLLSTIINIILDYLFVAIIPFGVAGVAWSTVIAQVMVCIVSFIYMYRKYEMFQFFGKNIRIRKNDLLEIIRTGLPIAAQSMVGTIFNVLIQRLVNSFGEAMIASYTVVSRVECYIGLPTDAFNQTIATYTAQNVGANKIDRISKGLHQTLFMGCMITLIFSILSFAFVDEIALFFGIQGKAVVYCHYHLRILAFPLLLFSLYFPCTGMYQGMGKGMVSTALSTGFLSICLLIAYTLSTIPSISMKALWICKPITWCIIVPINFIYYFKGNWKKV